MSSGNATSRADELLESVLRAHGGVDCWNTFEKVSAAFVTGGGLMPMKGINANPKPSEGIETIHYESTVISPFGKPDQRMVFTPERVVVETTSGAIVEERSNPRAAFAGHTLSTPWDLLHQAYFNGYARWTYLNTPFLLAMPGFVSLLDQPAIRYVSASKLAGAPHGRRYGTEGQLPRAPGHEVVGRIDVLGSGVQGWQSVSAWGVGFLAGSCDYCEFCRIGDLVSCRNQEYTGGPNGYIEYPEFSRSQSGS